MTDKELIRDRLEQFLLRLDHSNEIDSNQTKPEVINEIEQVAVFLNANGSLNEWTKSKLVGAINAFHWNWPRCAINRLILAIVDPEQVSPQNKYDEEVSKLTFDEIMEHITSIKENIR